MNATLRKALAGITLAAATLTVVAGCSDPTPTPVPMPAPIVRTSPDTDQGYWSQPSITDDGTGTTGDTSDGTSTGTLPTPQTITMPPDGQLSGLLGQSGSDWNAG